MRYITILITIIFCSIFGFESFEMYEGKIRDDHSRQEYNLNKNWFYLENNSNDYSSIENATGWIPIDLPHTWNNFDATDNNPGYRRSGSWYKHELYIPETKSNLIWQLYFEGVNISSEVYVNGAFAGSHVGGYVGFKIELNKHLKPGKKNIIHVRADNSFNPEIIPSQKSDFFIYGGITRDVYLKVLPADHIEHIKISTPMVSNELATTVVDFDIIKNSGGNGKVSGQVELINPQGLSIQVEKFDHKIKKGINKISIKMKDLINPILWDIDRPELYTIEVKINSSGNADVKNERFGYRWFEFEKNGPFYLNGKRLLLRGTHRHEEWAGYGNAMPNELHRKDMEMIKEMGANFVRLAHYPQDPEIYKACDELGLLVWDELPWCRGGKGGETWERNTERLLKEQISQNYNHPSIIIWSLGNELYWLPDFSGGDNPDELIDYLKKLNKIAHELDPYRLTAVRKFYDGAGITDVFSPSIWSGWYSGVYTRYMDAITSARTKYPRFFHAEYGGSSHVGRHNENPITGEGLVKEDEWEEIPNMVDVKNVSKEGDWSENYIVDLFDWHLSISEQLDWFPGNAQWAFKDFGTPLRPENPIPYINQKGLVDREGKPKDAYYVFKSYWTASPKFAYIESKTWTVRYGPENISRQISVFSNCNSIALVLNGNSLETKEKDLTAFPASGFHWDVNFSEGDNELIANGYENGKIVTSDTLIVHYSYFKHGKPVDIKLESTPLANGNYLIKAMVLDKNGSICTDYNSRVYFDLNGGGALKKYYGTPTGSDVIEFADGQASIEYFPEAGNPGTIEARTQDFKGSYIIIGSPE